MASTTSTSSLSFASRAQIQLPSYSPWLNPSFFTKSYHKNLQYLFNSTTTPFSSLSSSYSSSFPIKPRNPTISFHVRPLKDSIHGNFVDDLETTANQTDNFIEKLENSANIIVPNGTRLMTLSQESRRRILIQDPPWISGLFFKGPYRKMSNKGLIVENKDTEKRKYNMLRRMQIKEETEAWEKTVDEYRELERVMCEKKLAPNLPYVKGLFLGWFEPLREAIAKEQKVQKSKSKKVKAAYAPHIELLPPDKMAIIVMHKMIGLVMAGHENGCVQVVQAAVQIGVAIEHEVRIHSFLQKTKSYQRKNVVGEHQEDLSKEKEIIRKRVNSLIRRKRLKEAQRLVKNDEIQPWGRATQAKLGSRLVELLTETAYVQPPLSQSGDSPLDIRPAFRHTFRTVTNFAGHKTVRRYGVIECDQLILAGLEKSARHMMIPYVPMLVPPRKWKGYDKGGYMFLPSYVMRTHGSQKQQDALKSIPPKNMQKVFEVQQYKSGSYPFLKARSVVNPNILAKLIE